MFSRIMLTLLLLHFYSENLSAQEWASPHLIAKNYQAALTYYQKNYPDSALCHFHQVEALAEKISPEEIEKGEIFPLTLELIKQSYRWLGQIYGEESNFDLGTKYAQKSLDISNGQYGPNAPQSYWHYHQIADLMKYAGEAGKSIEYCKKAAFLLNQFSDTEATAYSLDSAKAALYSSFGHAAYVNGFDRETILQYFQTSLDHSKDKMSLTPIRMHCLLGMARFFTASKSFSEALSVLNRADSIWNTHHEEFLTHPEYYKIKRKLLRHHGYYWKKQNQHERAIDFYKQYIALSDQYIKRPREYLYLLTAYEISEIYFHIYWESGDFSKCDSAVFYTQQCLIKICDNYDPKSIYELPKLKDIKNRTFAIRVLRYFARYNQHLTTDRGDREERIKGLKMATAVTDSLDRLLDEVIKESIKLKGYVNIPLLDKSLTIYSGGLIFNYNLNQIKPTKELVEKSFYYIQKMKAMQIWLDQLKEEALQHLPDSIKQQEKQFLEKIQQLENQLYLAELSKDSTKAEKLRNIALFDTKRAYEVFQKSVEQTFPSYHLSKHDFFPKSIKQLKENLKEDEVVLEYTFNIKHGYVIAISKNDPSIFKRIAFNEEDIDEIQAAVKNLNGLLQRSPMHRKTSRQRFVSLSNYLYQRYILPVEPILKDKNRIIVIGEGLTNYVPYEVLLPTNELKAFEELNYLVKNYELSYHYSSTLFAKDRERKSNIQEGIYTFAPVYDQKAQGPPNADLIKSTSNNNVALRAFDNQGKLVPLPESEAEVNNILNLFSERSLPNNRLALRSDATETELKINLEKTYRFIHIAGHSFADLNNPLFSGIACHKTDQSKNGEGILYTGEIYNLKTQADLITLSSCESGFGKAIDTDGLVGLNRAFVLAGTPNVIFSLWKVYDKVSARIMTQFYDFVLEGNDYSNSLRAVKLDLIKDPVTASPHYWSPFLLIGR
jgi:CHAT domain-containing protein